MAAAKPHILIVPGSCHTAYHWRFFITSMQKAGYDAIVQNYPANDEDGIGDKPNAMDTAVATVRAAVMNLLEKNRDVVVVAHSVGGAIAGGALDGLGKVGEKPGVLRIVYIAAPLLEPGATLAEKSEEGSEMGHIRHRNGVAYLQPEWFFNELPSDLAEDAAKHLVGCSQSLSYGCVQSVCWYEVPSVYVICEKDLIIRAAIAELMLAGTKVDWDIVRIDADHSPFLGMPNRLAAIVRWASGERDVGLDGVKVDGK